MKLTTSTLDFVLPRKSDEESPKHDFAIRFGRFAFILTCCADDPTKYSAIAWFTDRLVGAFPGVMYWVSYLWSLYFI